MITDEVCVHGKSERSLIGEVGILQNTPEFAHTFFVSIDSDLEMQVITKVGRVSNMLLVVVHCCLYVFK